MIVGSGLSDRLQEIIGALPLRPGMRVLEIGCGPGAAARAVTALVRGGFVLGIDRSERAITAAIRGSRLELGSGRLEFRQVAAEHFELQPQEAAFDLAFAIRVGALDGRHPTQGQQAMERIRKALRPGAKLYIDAGSPLREISFES